MTLIYPVCHLALEFRVAKFRMGMFSYTTLLQKESTEKTASQTIKPSTTLLSRCYESINNALPTIAKAISLVAAAICLAILTGFVASKIFILNLVQSDQPGLLPEGFFPNC